MPILKNPKHEIAWGQLRGLLSYDPATGVFRWAVDRYRKRAGDVAGAKHVQGYLMIGVCGRRYLAHRLAWMYVHGGWPSKDIDHVNGDRTDNRIANLREATVSQNVANGKRRASNRSGFKGVSRTADGKGWRAYLTVGGKQKWLGRFDSAELAHAAYMAAARSAFGEFARGA